MLSSSGYLYNVTKMINMSSSADKDTSKLNALNMSSNINSTDPYTAQNLTFFFQKVVPMLHLRTPEPERNLFPDNLTNHNFNRTTNDLFSLVFEVFELSEILLALLLNGALFIMIMNQKKIRNTKSCKLFLNLQFVHVLLLTSNIIHKSYDGYNAFHIYMNNGLLIEMFLAMVLATIDRLIAIRFPYVYVNIQTKHTLFGVACSWLPGIIFTVTAVIFLPRQEYMSILSTVLLCVAMIILVSSNASVYVIARKQWHGIRTRCTQASFRGFKENKQLKSIYVCLSIVTSFFVFWMPYLVHSLMFLLAGDDAVNLKLTMCVELVAFANSLTDPILFVVFRKDARKEVRRLLKLNCART